EVALRLLEDLLPSLAGLGPALGPWHVPVSPAGLKIRDQNVQAPLIRPGDQHGLPELPLALRPPGLEQVALPPAAPLELARRGSLEPLGRGTLRFHLRHRRSVLRSSAALVRGSY